MIYTRLLNPSRPDVQPVKAALLPRIRRRIQVVPFRFEAALLIRHAGLIPASIAPSSVAATAYIFGIQWTGPCGAAAAEQLIRQGSGMLRRRSVRPAARSSADVARRDGASRCATSRVNSRAAERWVMTGPRGQRKRRRQSVGR